jgi:hypothetical protein
MLSLETSGWSTFVEGIFKDRGLVGSHCMLPFKKLCQNFMVNMFSSNLYKSSSPFVVVVSMHRTTMHKDEVL